MSFTSLAGRLQSLPVILAGPVLRRADQSSVTVWVALRVRFRVTLRVFSAAGQQVAIGTRLPVQLGEHLHVVAVTARVDVPGDPQATLLGWGERFFYNLYLDGGGPAAGDHAALDAPSLLTAEVLVIGQPNNAPGLARLNYSPGGIAGSDPPAERWWEALPGFDLPPANLADLRIYHGSCRKPHGEGDDMLALLDGLIDKSLAAGPRPHQLYLTGDQIYADDVSAALLFMLRDAATSLGIAPENLPGGPAPAALAPGKRATLVAQAGFTADADVIGSHLLTFGEFCAMYLFAWSPLLWPTEFTGLTTPAAFDAGLAADDESFLDEKPRLDAFLAALPRVRRALANIPCYMMFDDHEITDDLYLTRQWCRAALGSALGHRVIQNGLLAFALFQAWGNTPEQFAARLGAAPIPPGQGLLDALPDLLADKPAAWLALDALLGLPAAAAVAHWKDGVSVALGPAAGALSFGFRFLGPRPDHAAGAPHTFQAIVLDTRSHRSFPAGDPDDLDPAAALIGRDGMKAQVPDPPPGQVEVTVTFVISPSPVLSIGWVDWWQDGAAKFGFGKERPDYERWNLDRYAIADLLWRLGARFRGQKPQRVVALSGDVHYGYAMTARSLDPDCVFRLVQFVASSFKNQKDTWRLWKSTFYTQKRGYADYMVSDAIPEPREETLAFVPLEVGYVAGTQAPSPSAVAPGLLTLAGWVGLAEEQRRLPPRGDRVVGRNNFGEVRLVAQDGAWHAQQVLYWHRNSLAEAVTTTYRASLAIPAS